MILIPLPAIVATLLGLLLCLVLFQRECGSRPIILFLAAGTAFMIVVSLRWSFEAPVFRFLQPVFAALLPPAAWLCFSGLSGEAQRAAWPHALPGIAILLLSALWPWVQTPIDALLAALYFAYGGALIWRGLQGEHNFAAARLGAVVQPGRAAMFVGALLLFSGAIDLAIAIDFGMGEGTHVGAIVSAGNMVMLPLIAWAALVVTRSVPDDAELAGLRNAAQPGAQDLPAADHGHVLAEVHRVLNERRLYRDPDLTLERLARRVGIPGRQISQAINRELGRNVSQEVNAWRIREARELLESTDRTMTAIMFDCGFQTKSNFNSTFRRITGLSPSDWRHRARKNAESDLSGPEARDPEMP